VVLAILALPVLCAPRTVAGDLSAVAHGQRPGMVSNFEPDGQPRLPGARANGTSLWAPWRLRAPSLRRPRRRRRNGRAPSLAAANGGFNA